MTPTLKFVTDPMCAWCWAMSPHIETTSRNFDGRVAFDLSLGGINVRTVKPLGKHGLKRLRALWRRITAVTGQESSRPSGINSSFGSNTKSGPSGNITCQ